MDLLGQLMQSLKVAGTPRTMQEGRNGKPVPSWQGHLPPAQQKDTWLENDPRARVQLQKPSLRYNGPRTMQAGPDGRPMVSPQGYLPPHLQQDTWLENDPQAYVPPAPGRQTLAGRYPTPQDIQAGFSSIPDHITAYQEGNINSVGGKVGQYGGNIGLDDGRLFANMNRNGQPTDPMAELRRFLGL